MTKHIGILFMTLYSLLPIVFFGWLGVDNLGSDVAASVICFLGVALLIGILIAFYWCEVFDD